jgi:hypothetical protein
MGPGGKPTIATRPRPPPPPAPYPLGALREAAEQHLPRLRRVARDHPHPGRARRRRGVVPPTVPNAPRAVAGRARPL